VADKYANILYDEVVESAANTLTFENLDIGLSLFDKVGVLIHRLEWMSWPSRLAAASDAIEFGLTTSNSWSAADPSENSIITYHKVQVVDYGTAGNNRIFDTPLVDDFSTLPGTGILTTPRPLYMFVDGANLADVATVKMRMFFTIITLKADEYFELLETRQFFG